MGQRFEQLSEKHQHFIESQHLYFVATAARDGRVNLSPKGMDSLRVLGPNRVVWLNLTGSGNETATHLQDTPRMTLMWCAFDGQPLILRCYGQARALHPRDKEFETLCRLFPNYISTRQIIDVQVDLVQSSCGFAVPLMDFVEEREILLDWAQKKGRDGVEKYWDERNRISIDGKPTGILSDTDS